MSGESSGDEDRLRSEARRRVRGLRYFYVHASIYVVVIGMLTIINFMTGDMWHGNFWVQWPAMTWGAIVVIHALLAFGGLEIFGPDWEDRKVEEILRRKGPPRS